VVTWPGPARFRVVTWAGSGRVSVVTRAGPGAVGVLTWAGSGAVGVLTWAGSGRAEVLAWAGARGRAGELTGFRAGAAPIGQATRCPVRWSGILAATGIAAGCVVWHRLADQPVTHAMLALASIELIAGRSARGSGRRCAR
jgi:hypothetical protein